MSYTDKDHQAALKAARAGVEDATQRRKLEEASKQAGSRGDEARRALQGK